MDLRAIIAGALNDLSLPNPWRRWGLHLAAKIDSRWGAPLYNLGLAAKYELRWKDSLRFNQLAALRRQDDEAIWWNLGIAATALRDWPEARRAWKAAGVEIEEGDGEVKMALLDGCVRLKGGETVWGQRIDPVRIRVLNIPLIDSGHRFADIVLHDGASNGSRIKDGQEIPVFDELELWEKSKNSTFEAHLQLTREDSLELLIKALDDDWFGIEDWSSVSVLCAKCSEGTVESHDHSPPGSGRYALAAPSKEQLIAALDEWVSHSPGDSYSDLQLVCAA